MRSKQSSTIWFFIAPIILLLISACSDSNKQAESLPDFIEPISFSFIDNNALYAYNPETKESRLLASFDNNLIIALDTDPSKTETTKSNQVIFSQTATPEYFAYVIDNTINIFDLANNLNHKVYDFKADTIFDPLTNSYTETQSRFVCDIQKVITWDEEARLARKLLLKDELALYVKTSDTEDCENTTSINYWELVIEDSIETVTRRKRVLLEHSHFHRHEHTHDDETYEFADLHNHQHNLKEGETTSNHLHEHKHTHGFLYADPHHHDHLTKEEIDAVHNNLTYQDVLFLEIPLLKAKKTTSSSIDQALMYSGSPIIDTTSRKFGYLGFNESQKEFKFFTADPDSPSPEQRKKLLWSESAPGFSLPTKPALTNLERITPKYNRNALFNYAGQNIWFNSNTALYYFSFSDVFDDDQRESRQAKIASPLYVSASDESPLASRIKYNTSEQAFLITELFDLIRLDFKQSNRGTTTLIKRFNEANLVEIIPGYSSGRIAVHKKYLTDETSSNSTILIQENGLEDFTVMNKNTDEMKVLFNNQILFNSVKQDTGSFVSTLFKNDSSAPTEFYNASWLENSLDYRDNKETKQTSLLLSFDGSVIPESIYSPFLYLSINLADSSLQEPFGSVSQNVKSGKNVVVFNDYFGLLEVINDTNDIELYFLTNMKSSFNFNNEYSEMVRLSPVQEAPEAPEEE